MIDREECKEYRRVRYSKNKEKYKIEHGRQKSQCRDCGGSQICKHDRRKSDCCDYGGTQIYEHDRIKYRCRDCGGIGIREHRGQKNMSGLWWDSNM